MKSLICACLSAFMLCLLGCAARHSTPGSPANQDINQEITANTYAPPNLNASEQASQAAATALRPLR